MTTGLDPAERDLVRSVESRLPEELAFLEKVVDIDSGTFNTAGVAEVARAFQRELEALGFTARWLPLPEAMRRAGHLAAERVADQATGKRVLLMGHLDTIFEGRGHRFERAAQVARGAWPRAAAASVSGSRGRRARGGTRGPPPRRRRC